MTIYGDQRLIPCVFMRGGTSRGAILKREDLPSEPDEMADMISAIYGSPDIRQINGLGGATGQTSKVCVIGPPLDPSSADVEYTFGQVRIESTGVDFVGNCGNMTAAVAAFAIDEGYVAVPPDEKHQVVRIHLSNTDQLVRAVVPIINGKAAAVGSHRAEGVPGTGAPIDLDFSDTVGTLGKGVLPFDEPFTEIKIDDQAYTVSVVDVGNAAVFVRAAEVGMYGTELPAEINGSLLELLLKIRAEVAFRLGRCSSPGEAEEQTPATPKLYVISPPNDYVDLSGDKILAANLSFCSRGLIMGQPHESHAASVAVCAAVAAKIPGTIVSEIVDVRANHEIFAIGHPSGVMDVRAAVTNSPRGPNVESASLVLTARRLMSGVAYVPCIT